MNDTLKILAGIFLIVAGITVLILLLSFAGSIERAELKEEGINRCEQADATFIDIGTKSFANDYVTCRTKEGELTQFLI